LGKTILPKPIILPSFVTLFWKTDFTDTTYTTDFSDVVLEHRFIIIY